MMLAWATLLYLLSHLEAASEKAVLSFYPPWATIFRDETVTLVCDVSVSAGVMYTWYRDSTILTHERGKNKYYFRNAKMSDSGEYSCEVVGSGRSDPVPLTVSEDWVILQAPYSALFEGEMLNLRCLSWKNSPVSNVRFYKDDQMIRRYKKQQTFSIPNVTIIAEGIYTCEMEMGLITYNYKSAAVHISVRELFPPPVLEIKPSAPVEGSSISMTCKTELPAERRHRKLLFTFYKDKQVLLQKSESPEHNIKKAQLENSGEYFCQVQTDNLSVSKSSSPLQIHVQQLFTLPRLEIKPSTSPVEGSSVSLTCKTTLKVQNPGPKLYFSFYKDLWISLMKTDSPEYIIKTAQLADTGVYHCQVETVTASVKKESPQSRIHVERIPVSGISLEVQPSVGKLNEGEDLLVTCSVTTGTGLLTISLCTLDSHDCANRSALSLRREEFSVTMTERDNGRSYYCMASNDEQTAPIKSGPLQISVRLRVSQPVLRLDMDGHCAVVGDTMTMVCESLKGSPPIRYQFYHEQRVLGSLEVNQTGPGNLSVTVASEEDAGMYSCDAKNDISSSIQQSEAISLSVLVPVSGVTLSFNKESPEIWAGENLTLTCAVATGTSPAFHWLHNGKETNRSSEHYSVNTAGNILHIGSVQPLHGGSYQCWATNQLNAEKTFSASSDNLTITVLETSHILPTMGVIFSLLCAIILIAVLLFLYLKHHQKSDEQYFTSPVNARRKPQQRDSGQKQTLAAQQEEEEEEDQPEYSNVGVAACSQTEEGVLYTVINHEKICAAAGPTEDNAYFVTYTEVKDMNPAEDPAASAYEPSPNIYENFPCLKS